MGSATKEDMRIKEPVKVRTKVLKDKTQSIYLDICYQGKRSKEYLKLYLSPSGKTAQDKSNMLLANSIKGRKRLRVYTLHNKKAVTAD